MENCNLNTMTYLYFLERLRFSLFTVTVVVGVIAIVIAVAMVGLRWSAKLVQPAIQPSAANDGKFCEDLKDIPANNVTPMQAVSTDKGKLVI